MIQIVKKILGFRNMQEKLENNCSDFFMFPCSKVAFGYTLSRQYLNDLTF